MRRIAVLALFFLSGISALAYEVIWQSRLANIIGATSLSAALVLTVFMGGLALGASAARSLTVRWFSGRGTGGPIGLFAASEAGIGIWALCAPLSFGLASKAGAMAGIFPFKPVFDMLLAALVMLPPAFLMGLTLPALTDHLARGKLRESLGAAYFSNVSGGAAGSLAWGLWLIPAFGLRSSELAAAFVNLAIACSVLVFFRNRPEPLTADPEPGAFQTEEGSSPKGTDDEDSSGNFETIAFPAMAIFAASGLSMALEVLFFRFNLLVVGATAHSFSIMLAGFLAGISFGTALSRSFLARGFNPVNVSFIASLAALAGLGGAAALCEKLPYLFHLIRNLAAGSFGAWLACKALFCGVLTFLPAAGLGALFPALHSEIARRRGGESVSTSGLASAVSSTGSLAGSLVTGLVLLPGAGLPVSLGAVAGLTALLCFTLALASSWTAPTRTAGGILAAAIGLCSVLWFSDCGPHAFISGVFYRDASYGGIESFEDFRRVNGSRAIVFFKDDGEALVSVTSRDGFLGLQVNGKTDASNMPDDMATQLALGHLPVLFTEGNPGRSLVLGWGSGVTAAAVALHSPQSLSCVEISPAVISASRLFSRANGEMAGGRATLVNADGRVYMATLPGGSCDLVVSEPSNPWISGMSRLFTVEHFANVRRILSPRGVFFQWIQSYEMDDDTFRIIVRSFLTAFPGASLWALGHHDFGLLFTGQPPEQMISSMDFSRFSPRVMRDLEEIGLDSRACVAASMVMSPAALASFAGAGGVNTDDAMVLQYRTPRFLMDGTEVSGVRVNLGVLEPGGSFSVESRTADGRPDPRACFQGARRLEILGDRKTAARLYEQAVSLDSGYAAPRIHLAGIEAGKQRLAEARALLSQLSPDLDPETLKPSTKLVLARLSEDAGNHAAALILREQLLIDRPDDLHNRTAFARDLRKTGLHGKSHEILEELTVSDPLFGPAWLDLGLDFLGSEKFDLAEVHLSKAVDLDPADVTALHNLGVARMKSGKFVEAASSFAAATAARPGWHAPWINLAECLVKSGKAEDADEVYGDLIDRFPEKPVVLNNAGAHFAGRRNYSRAIEAYSRLASVDLRYADAAIAEIERLRGFMKTAEKTTGSMEDGIRAGR